MTNKNLYWLTVLLFFFSASKGQQAYRVGISRVSTEPDSTILSIALSGYGYPPEGRFSINWTLCGDLTPNISAITGFEGKLIAADSNNVLWSGTLLAENISWNKIGQADNIIALAGLNGSIYAVNDKGNLLLRKTSRQNERWVNMATPGRVKTLAALNGDLYATSYENELLKMDPSLNNKHWIKVSPANDIRSLVGNGKRLFAVNPKDTLWNILPYNNGASWKEIGRFNGLTFNIHIKQIVVLKNRFYAVSADDKLYIGNHSTDGDLSATAFAINCNSKTIVMVGVDLTGFDYSLTNEVKEIVSKERHITKSAILINASHTHFCPSAQAYPVWEDYLVHPDSVYLNNILKKGMVKAIENAIDKMAPADLYFGRGTTDIGSNRSSPDPENPHDKTLDVLQAKNKDGKIIGTLFLTGCHPVFNNEGREAFTISANFPGIARDLIREKTGSDAIFIQGCGGDINPRSESSHKETGTQLANDVFKVMNASMTLMTGDISYSFNSFTIPLELTIPTNGDKHYITPDSINKPLRPWNIDSIKQFKINNENSPELVARRNVRWANLMLSKAKKGPVSETMTEYIQILDIGNWKMVGLSREAVNEYGPAARNIWPDKIVSVAGYCNDIGSYLPNKWHITNRFYEGHDSFFWYGHAGVPPLNIFDLVIHGIQSAGR